MLRPLKPFQHGSPTCREKVDIENRSLKIDPDHAGSLLSSLYERYHRREYLHPDPLELVLRATSEEREVTAIVASSLALGKVDLILRAAGGILDLLQEPTAALRSLSGSDLRRIFENFRYRFFSGVQLANFLVGVGGAIKRYGTLETCFLSGLRDSDTSTLPALGRFVKELQALAPGDIGILLSDPSKGSASKRLHLFLRWMIRNDAIDPGGWRVPPSKLIVPADVHMLKVSRLLGFTERRQPDLGAAMEITAALSKFSPEDPVRFDFSMTRLGIHPDLTYAHLYRGLP